MIETDLSSITIEKLQEGKNRDKIFRLIWIQNLDLSDYQFWVLFKLDEPNGRYVTTKVAPEHISLYTPGAYYLNGQRLEYPLAMGESIRISLETFQRNPLKLVSHAFTDDLYDLRHSSVTYSRSQYCVVIETEDAEFIFPCFLLGAVFYFSSASMRRQLFAQSLEGLYEPNSIHVNPITRRAKIHLKPNAADSDAADIIRFETNANANKQWLAIVNRLRKLQPQRRIEKMKERVDTNFPIVVDFPVAAKLSLIVRAVSRFDFVKNKHMILVLDIEEENSPFDFDKYTRIRTIGSLLIKEEVQQMSTRRRTSNVLTVRVPSPDLTSVELRNPEPVKNINKRAMTIENQYEEDSERIGPNAPRKVHADGKTDISLRDTSPDGDAGARHGEIMPPELAKKEVHYKECFTLKDFHDMIIPLVREDDVEDFKMIGPVAMPRRTGDHLKGSLWEYTDKEHTISRKYLAMTLVFKSIHVCLIEIDQNGLPSPTATYVFISSASAQMSLQEVWEFLEMVVNREIIEAISAKFLSRGYVLYAKKHPEKKIDEYYRGWRKNLLKRIELLTGTLN